MGRMIERRYNMVGRPPDVRALTEHLNCALAPASRRLPRARPFGVVSNTRSPPLPTAKLTGVPIRATPRHGRMSVTFAEEQSWPLGEKSALLENGPRTQSKCNHGLLACLLLVGIQSTHTWRSLLSPSPPPKCVHCCVFLHRVIIVLFRFVRSLICKSSV